MVDFKFNTRDLDPFAIGFNSVFDQMISNSSRASNSYPPYNIRKIDDELYAIEIAVAGFDGHNLDIQLKENTLTVKGSIPNEEKNDAVEYLYKGISTRSFVRQFTLSDRVVVSDADLNDGILSITLEDKIPEEKKARTINISGYYIDEDSKELLNEEK